MDLWIWFNQKTMWKKKSNYCTIIFIFKSSIRCGGSIMRFLSIVIAIKQGVNDN